jgi:hypothetical protein
MYMANMTLAVPDDLHKAMKKHKEIRWSEVARKAMWEQARKMDLMESIVAKSTLREEDALYLGRKINKGIARNHGLVK